MGPIKAPPPAYRGCGFAKTHPTLPKISQCKSKSNCCCSNVVVEALKELNVNKNIILLLVEETMLQLPANWSPMRVWVVEKFTQKKMSRRSVLRAAWAASCNFNLDEVWSRRSWCFCKTLNFLKILNFRRWGFVWGARKVLCYASMEFVEVNSW